PAVAAVRRVGADEDQEDPQQDGSDDIRCARVSTPAWWAQPDAVAAATQVAGAAAAVTECLRRVRFTSIGAVRLLLLGLGPLPLVPLGLTSLPLRAAPPLSPTRARGAGVVCHVIHPRNQVDERHPPAAVSRVHRGRYAAPPIGRADSTPGRTQDATMGR